MPDISYLSPTTLSWIHCAQVEGSWKVRTQVLSTLGNQLVLTHRPKIKTEIYQGEKYGETMKYLKSQKFLVGIGIENRNYCNSEIRDNFPQIGRYCLRKNQMLVPYIQINYVSLNW